MASQPPEQEKITTVRTIDFRTNEDEQQGVGLDEKANSDQFLTVDDVATGGLTGVERIRATTQAWTKPWLITAFILSVISNLLPSAMHTHIYVHFGTVITTKGTMNSH